MLKRYWFSLFLFIIIFSSVYANEQLVFAVDIVRHGDRTPIINLPTAPHHWSEGLGQLTPQGMRQSYQLGVSLRKKYVDEYHLLPAHYQVDTLYVRSSDVDRTLMTAQSFLLGLYPLGTGPYLAETSEAALPKAYQPVPIHTIPFNKDTMLNPAGDEKKTRALIEKYVASTPEWKQKTAELQPKFPEWSRVTGIPITQLYQLMSLGDTLAIYQRYHVKLPDGLTAADTEEIISAGNWAATTIFKSHVIGKLAGRELLTFIADKLQAIPSHTFPLKYLLITAHDTTLLGVMGALQAPLSETPAYAADLAMDLFENDTQQYTVKVTYQNEPVLIPACHSNSCTLPQFITLVNHLNADS